MIAYLFDASAAVELYDPRDARTKKGVDFIAEQRTVHRKAMIYIPNFCVVEVFNSLARKHFKDHKLERAKYEEAVKKFRDDVHWGKTLYFYDLNRYHVLGADEVIPVEHHTASEHERDHLSTFDILIIVMASELAFVGEPGEVYLVTCDRRIKKVVEQFKAAQRTERETWKVLGNIDVQNMGRRYLPNAVYLPALKRGELPTVAGQKPLSF